MKRNIKSFTLVEMLIVMGIIIILMAVGIASGRFAIRRANKIEHQNSADQIYQALQSYYSDNREYPGKGCSNENCYMPSELIKEDNTGPLDEYIDDFDGGSEASYAYYVNSTGQECIICVTYGGVRDENRLGMYCTGSGIGSDKFSQPVPRANDLDYGGSEVSDYQLGEALFIPESNCSNWQPSTSNWNTTDTNCDVPDIVEGPSPE